MDGVHKHREGHTQGTLTTTLEVVSGGTGNFGTVTLERERKAYILRLIEDTYKPKITTLEPGRYAIGTFNGASYVLQGDTLLQLIDEDEEAH